MLDGEQRCGGEAELVGGSGGGWRGRRDEAEGVCASVAIVGALDTRGQVVVIRHQIAQQIHRSHAYSHNIIIILLYYLIVHKVQ